MNPIVNRSDLQQGRVFASTAPVDPAASALPVLPQRADRHVGAEPAR